MIRTTYLYDSIEWPQGDMFRPPKTEILNVNVNSNLNNNDNGKQTKSKTKAKTEKQAAAELKLREREANKDHNRAPFFSSVWDLKMCSGRVAESNGVHS